MARAGYKIFDAGTHLYEPVEQSESWFPKSVDRFLAWQSISAATKRKLLWDNPLRCYHRYAAKHGGA